MDKIKDYTVSKFRIRYTVEFKHQVCREFLSGQYSKTELQEKYDIKGKARLLNWLRELGYMEYIRENSIQVARKYRVTKTKILKRKEFNSSQLEGLQNALQDAQLEAAAYRKMIELAEEQFKIKIRKNLNTK